MGLTPVDLFRSGNAGGPRLTLVRPVDVDTYAVAETGMMWVRANGRGMSTWDAVDPTWRGKPWRLAAGSPYPDDLLLWNDMPGHWVWAALQDITLSDYISALEELSALFVRVV